MKACSRRLAPMKGTPRVLRPLAFAIIATALLAAPVGGTRSGVHPLFGLDAPHDGPFPSDRFTEPDPSQLTGLRVNLPLPQCADLPSDCDDVAVLNELDGFNLQPRLSIPFSGPIDPETVTSDTVFLLGLGSGVPGRSYDPVATVVGIDQVVWDAATNTLHVESDALLAEHSRFALVVTRGVRDEGGSRVEASEEFRRFRAWVRDRYQQALLEALWAAGRLGVREEDIAVASVFTTRSATAVLEKIREQIHASTPEPADFLLGTSGERTVFSASEIASVAWNQQTGDEPPAFTLRPLDLSAIRTFAGAVGTVAFGKYFSSDYAVHPGESIPAVGTLTGTPAVHGTNEIYFNVYLPSGPVPPGGWPVALVGHGVQGSKNVAGNFVGAPVGDRHRDQQVSALAANGIASITTNAAGYGFGPKGTLTVTTVGGASVTFFAGGRGIDQAPQDHVIGANEGVLAAAPRGLVLFSDAFRQTAADLMQLVRVIQAGMDVDGNGVSDLDASRIYYVGLSWSAGYGTVFMAVEPDVRLATLKAPADPVGIAALGPGNRRTVGGMLAARHPSLLNSPGVSVLDGVAVGLPRFDEEFPLRDRVWLAVTLEGGATREIRSPVTVTDTVAGAMAIQELFDRIEWVSQAGSPVAYAAHLRKAPLPDVPAKDVLFVILKGDQTTPNPSATAIVRAGDLADRTMYYRHDLAVADNPALLPAARNPHAFSIPTIAPGYLLLDPVFFATGGTTVFRPAPEQYFEFPLVGPLPEGLNFIR